MTDRADAGPEGYGDWRSLELAIKDAAKRATGQSGPGVSAASVDAQIRQARFDRFLSRVFAEGELSEWLLKGGMSMLARVPRSRTTKDVDLAALRAPDLTEAERTLAALAEADLGDHLTFRLIRSTPTGLGENQPGVATRRYVFACIDADYGTQVDTVTVDVVVGPPPVGRPEVVEPANRLHLRRPLVTFPYRLYPVADQIADKVCATMDTQYPGGKRSTRVKDLVDLVLIARTQTVDLGELRTAIAAKRELSRIGPFEHFDIPPNGPARTLRPRRASRRPSHSQRRPRPASSRPSSARRSVSARARLRGTRRRWPGFRTQATHERLPADT
ncbi:MAG TPA: nucleotidyl transferase AbiEii/AbiGii toxin family protein [Trebonia sp.]